MQQMHLSHSKDKMDKKTFSRFVNHLEGFTQRIIERYPNMKDFIEQEKRGMLENFLNSGKRCLLLRSRDLKWSDTLQRSINTGRQKCYQAVDEDIKRETPEDCITSLNLLSRAIRSAHKDILYYSSLQGEMLKALKELCSPESYRLILRKNIDMSKTHANFLLRFYELVDKYPRLLFCELPQNYFVKHFNTIKLVCDADGDYWSNM